MIYLEIPCFQSFYVFLPDPGIILKVLNLQ